MKIFYKAILTGFAVISTVMPLQAQESYSPPPSALISHTSFHMKVVQKYGAPRNEITLRLFTPFPIQGCAAVQPFHAEYEIVANMARVTLDFPILDVDKSVRYPHYECKYSGNDPSTDLTFNLDELNEKMVTRVAFKANDQVYAYGLYFDDTVFRLTPVGNPQIKPLHYWRLPENTVVLSIPSALGDLSVEKPDLVAQLYTMAQSRNLTPMQDVIPGFGANTPRVNRFFFVDESGALAKTLTPGENTSIGALKASEPFYGPNGKFDKPKLMEVFVSLPAVDD